MRDLIIDYAKFEEKKWSTYGLWRFLLFTCSYTYFRIASDYISGSWWEFAAVDGLIRRIKTNFMRCRSLNLKLVKPFRWTMFVVRFLVVRWDVIVLIGCLIPEYSYTIRISQEGFAICLLLKIFKLWKYSEVSKYKVTLAFSCGNLKYVHGTTRGQVSLLDFEKMGDIINEIHSFFVMLWNLIMPCWIWLCSMQRSALSFSSTEILNSKTFFHNIGVNKWLIA